MKTLALLTLSAISAFGQTPASIATVLLHGRIYTANQTQPWAQAVAIRGDQIIAVGTDEQVMAKAGTSAKVIDLHGRMTLPGLIDTHTHFLWGSYALAGIRLDTARNVAEVKQRVQAYATAHPTENWVYGAGWQYGSFWPTGLPTKDLLDASFPNRPVVILSGDGHSLWVNSKALALAHITRSTPDPVGAARGTIMRDKKTGEPTGVLEEGAKRLVLDVMKVAPAEQFRRLHLGMEFANQRGITSVVNATGDIPEMAMYAQLHSQGQLTVRMTTAFAQDVGVRHTLSPEELSQFETARSRFHDDWVRAGIIKFFADGVIETHSAAMLEPYSNSPSGDKGTALYTLAEFKKDFLELDKRGFQVMTHAIGDGAVRSVLDAYEYVVQQDGPRDRRWRIEHMETVNPADFSLRRDRGEAALGIGRYIDGERIGRPDCSGRPMVGTAGLVTPSPCRGRSGSRRWTRRIGRCRGRSGSGRWTRRTGRCRGRSGSGRWTRRAPRSHRCRRRRC